jgi:hypothetical protein
LGKIGDRAIVVKFQCRRVIGLAIQAIGTDFWCRCQVFIKWPLGRAFKLGDDIKMGLREINCECGNRIELMQDHV